MTPHPNDPGAFLEATPLVPIDIDADHGQVRYVGPQSAALLGYPREVWYAPDFWASHVLPDDQATMADARRNTVASRGRHEVDYRIEDANGRVVWIAEILRYVDTPAGPSMCGFLWDITGRKRQEVALWKNEERVRGLIRRAPDAMVLTDTKGVVLNMNDQAESLFDYAPSDIVGSSIEHLVPEALRPRLAELRAAFERDPDRRSLVEGQPFPVQRADGTEVPVELGLSRVSGDDEDGTILWSARDLTVRRRVEAQRRAGAFEVGPDAPPLACSSDLEGRVVHVDAALAERSGESKDQWVGAPVEAVLGAELYAQLRGTVDGALGGLTAHRRCEIAREGIRQFVDVLVTPRYADDAEIVGYKVLVLP